MWVTQEISKVVFILSEGRLERNSVAAFLLMVKNLIRHHPVNQEGLLHCHGPSIIGAMLSKVSACTTRLFAPTSGNYRRETN